MPEIVEGEISGTQIGTDRFIIIQKKGSLKGTIKATFDMASRVLFIRKGDMGSITINAFVEYGGKKSLFANYGPLTRYPAPENEVEYDLPEFSFEQSPKKS